MSWLLVALIPGLLMLATFGLDRVESSLRRDAISATDVAEFRNQAEADDVDELARDGMNSALHGQQRRLHGQDCAIVELVDHVPAADLPTHRDFRDRDFHDPDFHNGDLHDRANPKFQQTRHPNPV